MNLYSLALRNTFRNRPRAVMTLSGVAVLTLAFIFLRTLISAFNSGAEQARTDRLIVRNRVSLAMPLPMAYMEKIKAIPGVGAVSYSNWFGGTYIDARNFFPRLAVEPRSYFEVYASDVTIDPDELAAFTADRTGCLIGEGLVGRYQFKKGDVIHLQGDIYPGDWAFTVRGTFKSKNSFANSALYMQYNYLDKSMPESMRGTVGSYALMVKNPDDSPRIAKAIDAMFANSANETITESEQAFALSFVAGSQAIIGALQAVSVVLLAIMLLIMGNTLAMAVRERTSEIAVLRTIGFQPPTLRLMLLAEGFWLGALGGVAGVLMAQPIINAFLAVAGGFVRASAAGRWMGPAFGIAIGVGIMAAFIPAMQAARTRIVDALRRVE